MSNECMSMPHFNSKFDSVCKGYMKVIDECMTDIKRRDDEILRLKEDLKKAEIERDAYRKVLMQGFCCVPTSPTYGGMVEDPDEAAGSRPRPTMGQDEE